MLQRAAEALAATDLADLDKIEVVGCQFAGETGPPPSTET